MQELSFDFCLNRAYAMRVRAPWLT